MDATHAARLPSPLLLRFALLAFGAIAMALLVGCEQSGATAAARTLVPDALTLRTIPNGAATGEAVTR